MAQTTPDASFGPLFVFVGLRWPSLAVVGRCGPALACVGLRPAKYNLYKIVSFKGTKREKKHTLLRLKRVPRPALACVGLRWTSLAVVGHCGPSLTCAGLRWPSLAVVGRRWPLWAFVDLRLTFRGPSLAFVDLRWPSLAVVGCCVTKIK